MLSNVRRVDVVDRISRDNLITTVSGLNQADKYFTVYTVATFTYGLGIVDFYINKSKHLKI